MKTAGDTARQSSSGWLRPIRAESAVTIRLTDRRDWAPFLALGILWVIVAALVIPTWGWTYWDFGDGNYMYVARRVREGLTLYKDILAPQPPLHVVAGMAAQIVGNVFGNELFGVRAYCLLSRFAASLAILLLARRLFDHPVKSVLAAGIYLFLPIGFWWSMCYESENLEIVFLLFSLFFLTSWTRNGAIAAGVLSALACHCNMTALPYFLVNMVFLLLRIPALAGWYAGACIAIYTVIAVIANILSGGFFADNVLFNQVGTFPRTDILSAGNPGYTFLKYAVTKITTEGYKIIEIEGALIAAAFVGILSTLRRIPSVVGGIEQPGRAQWLRAEFLAWSTIGLMLSICFTAKGGTVNYIFCLGEPGVALFAAEALCLLWCGRIAGFSFLKSTHSLLAVLACTIVTFLLFVAPARNIALTLTQQQSELNAAGVADLRNIITNYAKPGDEILAPPFYAYATRTNVSAELAENYIWQIKWMNESFDAQMYGKPTGDGVEKMNELARAIAAKKPKIILLDTAQTGRVQVIANAIHEYYIPANPPRYQTRNTVLEIWVPLR